MIPLANEFGGGLVIYLVIIFPFVTHIEMGIVEYYVAAAKKSPEEIQKILEAIKHRLNTTVLNLLSIYDVQFRHGIVQINHHFTLKHSLTIIGVSTTFMLIGTATLLYGLFQSPNFLASVIWLGWLIGVSWRIRAIFTIKGTLEKMVISGLP